MLLGPLLLDPKALLEDLATLRKEVERLQIENDHLRKENERLQQESREWRKGYRVRGRRKRARSTEATKDAPKPPGRKLGHVGVGRTPPKPDRVQDCKHLQCPDCHDTLVDLGVGDSRTVEELVIRTETTRYQCWDQYCSRCDKTFRAPLPPELGGVPKIGPEAQAIAMSLRFEHGLGVGPISRIFSGVFGLPFSPGGLSQMFGRNLDKFAPAVTKIWTVALSEDVLNCDETGWYQNGKRAWMHAATNENLSLFLITDHRDRESFETLVPATYEGYRVTDDFSIYDHLPEELHPECWAHVLRTARDLYEICGDRSDGKAFFAISDFIEAAKVQRAEPSEAHRATAVAAFEAVLTACFWAKHEKLYRLCKRLSKKRRRYLLCLDDPSIPLTNNQVERDLRFSILARKMSFGTRNETGSLQWADGVTLSQTLKKQGQSLRQWIPPALAAVQTGESLPPVFKPPLVDSG